MPANRVLLVDVNPRALDELYAMVAPVAVVDRTTSFLEARLWLSERRYGRLFTNLRLRDHNGIHLAYLGRPYVRSVVYTPRRESFLQSEVHIAGGFYERYDRLLHSIRAYVESALPPLDRRQADDDRRVNAFRGGRRASDVAALSASSAFDETALTSRLFR